MYVVIGPDGKDAAPVNEPTLRAWAQAGQLPPEAPVRTDDGRVQPARELPELKEIYQPTTTYPSFIPAGNPDALWSYYTGLFSLFPLLGLPLGIFALVKGIKALKKFKIDASIRGRAHAWVGIVVGSLGTLINGAITLAIVSALLNPKGLA